MRVGVQAHLDGVVAELYGRGIVTTGEEAAGPIAETIGRVAREGVDLIVMGTHGFSGPRRALLGSVADKVLRTAALADLPIPEGVAIPADAAQDAVDIAPDTQAPRHAARSPG